MITWFISTKVGRAVGGALLALGAVVAFYWFAYDAGGDAAEQAQKGEALENTREREKNDQKIDSLPDSDLDARFTRWVRPE